MGGWHDATDDRDVTYFLEPETARGSFLSTSERQLIHLLAAAGDIEAAGGIRPTLPPPKRTCDPCGGDGLPHPTLFHRHAGPLNGPNDLGDGGPSQGPDAAESRCC